MNLRPPHLLALLRRVAVVILCAMLARTATAQVLTDEIPAQARGLDIEEHLGKPLPLELNFTNSAGKPVILGDYFTSGKPAVIAMVYYKCPVVCTVVMDKLAQCVGKLDLDVGKDFQVLVFSFNPAEGPELAAERKTFYLDGYPRKVTDETRASWEFHVGPVESNRALADALGFRYRRLENGEYSHPIAIYVATPEGKIARYIYGFDYPPRDIKLALNEAAAGKLSKSLGDRLLNFCYMYDPKAGSYTLQATRVMQIGGVLTTIALAALVGVLLLGERMRRKAAARAPAPSNAPHGDADPSASHPSTGIA